MASKKYRQGVFTPKNQSKFIGTKAVYRSGLELKFFRFCDDNKNILKWSSENVVVPYVSPVDGRVHRYFVDNYIQVKEGNNVKNYLVEIKPFRQTKPPATKYKKKQHLLYEQKQWAINTSKWESARKYAKQKGWEFIIITEKDLK
jgi:hypothetical protein